MKGELLLFSISLLILLNLSFITAPPPPPNATFENVNVINNLTVGNNLSTTTGFFSFLGTAVSRITKGWFTDLDVVNLVVGNNTLFVDGTNNLVGIGTTTPQNTLEVVGGSVLINATHSNLILDSPSMGGDPEIKWRNPTFAFEPTLMFLISGPSNDVPINSMIFDPVGANVFSFFRGDIPTSLFVINFTDNRVGIHTSTPQNALNIIGATNSTAGYITGAFTGITGNFSTGNCWLGINGGIITSTNCTAL